MQIKGQKFTLYTDIMDDLKIAIAGVGTVGNGVLILLKKNSIGKSMWRQN